MSLTHPLVIYSRMDLNHMLLARAERAGASIEKTRVLGIERREQGLAAADAIGDGGSGLLHYRDGRRNPLREVGTEWSADGHDERAGILCAGVAGAESISSFCRNWKDTSGCSRGAAIFRWGFAARANRRNRCGRGWSSTWTNAASRGRASAFYSHMLPSLETPGWKKNRVAGEGWMAVGDAAGLVDPITGEGLYYAMRSGDLASRVLIDDAHGLAGESGGVSRAVVARVRGWIWSSRRRWPSECFWAASCSTRCRRG